MRMRKILVLIAGMALAMSTAGPVWAHANLRASVPSRGAALETGPEQISITFTEPPDTDLTSVTLAGRAGTVAATDPQLAPGNDLTVSVRLLDELTEGTYSVSWRTVSKVDGHTSAGGFAFGVGEPPDPDAQTEVDDKASADPAASLSRWVLYIGLSLMLGASWLALFALRAPVPGLDRLAVRSWWVAAAGLVGLGASLWADSEAGLWTYVGSSAGRAWALRAAPLLFAGLGLGFLRSRPAARRYVVLSGTVGTMLAHSMASHAAVAPNAWPKVGAQWVHMIAVGLWIGGLAALLLVLRQLDPEDRARAAKRFSAVAAVSIFALVGTGVFRSVNELGSLRALTGTAYGQLIIGKAVLVVALGLLGAVNRFRNVPVAGNSPDGLRKFGRLEIAVAMVALALAGTLSNSVPPVSQAEAAPVQGPVEVSGSNFAGTARARLRVTPGTAGINGLELELTGDSGGALTGRQVTLTLRSLSDPQLPASRIDLQPQGGGRFEATVPDVANAGRYLATLNVGSASDSFEIPLEFSTRGDYSLTTSQARGQPQLYMLTDPDGIQLQLYSDPEQPGPSEVHLTFFGTDGTELPVDNLVVLASYNGRPSDNLSTRRFGPGHFVADIELESGEYLFDTTARTEDQQRIRFLTEVKIP